MTRQAQTRSCASVILLVACGVAACGSDATEPLAGRRIQAEVLGPAAISAAVMDFNGVSGVEVVGGDVFSRVVGTTLRSVIVLYEPGVLQLTLTLDGSAATPTSVLVDVADADGLVPPSLDGYSVLVGS